MNICTPLMSLLRRNKINGDLSVKSNVAHEKNSFLFYSSIGTQSHSNTRRPLFSSLSCCRWFFLTAASSACCPNSSISIGLCAQHGFASRWPAAQERKWYRRFALCGRINCEQEQRLTDEVAQACIASACGVTYKWRRFVSGWPAV